MNCNYKIITLMFSLIFCVQLSFSQNTEGKEESIWSFEMGLSAVDLYPVGEDAPQNEYFDEFLNLNDHWNLGIYVGVTRKFTDNLSFTAKGTINEISKWGGFGNEDESVLVDNLKYYALDGMINYTFGKRKLKPFFAVGGGYTWIEEGLFNTFSDTGGTKNLIGAGTVNGSIGVKYLISDKFTVSLQTTYKHSFEDYLTKHWDHNLGVAYKLEKLQQATLQIEHTTPKETPWSFETGLSVVNLFPVGESEPQGEYFDEFFNLNDHWNLGFYAGVTRHISNNLSISAKGITNEISKWGGFGNADESALVDNLKYYGLDGMINYSFGQSRMQPFLAVGGGYTWIEEGPFNTLSATNGSDNLVGAGTLNGSVGVKYWISDRIGINLQTTYKHSFEDYLPKHWDHSLGLVYKVNRFKKVEEAIADIDEDGVPDDYDLCPNTYGLASLGGCPDTDGDGIADKDDLCPEVSGTMDFGGCPDTDGDGFPDNRDNCPNEAGTDNGCPSKVIETTPKEKPIEGIRKVYFYNASANLDENAKVTLDEIAANLTTSDVNYTIDIEGHADSRGSDSYNYDLSLARAKAIKDYLTSKNVPDSSISISGKGEKEPIASNDTADGRALNRRVELTINVTAK